MFAVMHRQNEVFQFICGFLLKNAILFRVNNNGNNILHMVVTLEASARRNTVPGAAFLMQREVQWFKAKLHPCKYDYWNISKANERNENP
jgi:hypothetical protein